MAKILVIDDEEDMRLAVMNTLSLAGYEVLDAPGGAEALKKIPAEKPDLCLLDMRLPDMDGLQILRRIKESHPKLPVIMVTGFGSVETAVETVRLGATDYISKPFENQDLFQRIEKALSAGNLPSPQGPITNRLIGDLGVQVKIDDLPPTVTKPAPGKSGVWRKVALAAAALALLGGGGFLAATLLEAKLTPFGVSTTHVSGLTWDGERLWMSDWFNQAVYECKVVEDQIVVSRTFRLPDAHPGGLAWSGGGLYISDSWAQTISKHALDANLSVMAKVKSPGGAPGGIHFDGQRLWSTDSGEDRIYGHSPGEELAAERNVRALGTNPVDVKVRDGLLWVADADTRRLYQYRLDADLTPVAMYTHPLLQEQTHPLSSFLIVDKFVWFSFEGDNKIYRLALKALKKLET